VENEKLKIHQMIVNYNVGLKRIPANFLGVLFDPIRLDMRARVINVRDWHHDAAACPLIVVLL
jgi:hypothetical protein